MRLFNMKKVWCPWTEESEKIVVWDLFGGGQIKLLTILNLNYGTLKIRPIH